MTALPILGGFKILKDVVRISIVSLPEDRSFPSRFCEVVAKERINLPYFTFVYNRNSWGMNLMVEALDEERTVRLIEGIFGKIFKVSPRKAVLSLFPHKNNPAVTGTLFETLTEQGFAPEALANSPSAISVVLKEEFLNQASDALFGPFSFSAYRTPSDWKLAQKGKEQLYKEVVASYQEKKPKVYGLNYRKNQTLLIIRLDIREIGSFGKILKGLAPMALDLSFLASSPDDHGEIHIFFCLPGSVEKFQNDLLKTSDSEIHLEEVIAVAMFSMTGPHFGDRYGIASELLRALNNSGIDLLAFTCTIASIRGVIPMHQIEQAIQAIKNCFEVPAVTKKD
jgi:aspartokinase